MLLGGSSRSGALLATIAVGIAAILLSTVHNASPYSTITSAKSWDDSILRDLAQSYRQRLFAIQEETCGANAGTTKNAGENTTRTSRTAHKPLDGIVILVTGSTSGIGRSLVRWTYQEGATILAMGRSRSKLEELQDELVEKEPADIWPEDDTQEFGLSSKRSKSATAASNESKYIDVASDTASGETESSPRRFFPIVADMADLVSVSSAVDDIRMALSSAKIRRIDIVVCNAGIWLSSDAAVASTIFTKQGYDLTFGVNYLSHFLLTEKLMRTRVADVGSDSDVDATCDNDDDDSDQYLLSPTTSRVVQVSSTFNMGVDGTALSMGTKGDCKAWNDEQGSKKSNVENDTGFEASTGMSCSPPASHVYNASTSSQQGFILHSLTSMFRSQRQYANSKLAQLLHARMSNRNYFGNLGKEGNKSYSGSTKSKNRMYIPFVSACPGWVGTKILRSKIENESWRERLFHAAAFDVDGYGLSSILKAMFDPLLFDFVDENQNNNNKYNASIDNWDYFPNFCGLLAWSVYVADRTLVLLESMSSKVFGTHYFNDIFKYIRDVLSIVGCSLIVLWIQRFFTTSDVHTSKKHTLEKSQELFRHRSSTASYDRTLQHDLYEWSSEAVADYL